MSHNIDERLKKCSEDGDVDALYTKLAQDPYLLERFDRIPIVDTPLHIAAIAGNVQFAMEIASLKPSLAWKLNPLGLSPLHLALQHGHDQLVRAMVAVDSELVRVKAKGRVTPLHYVAQVENIDLLAEFLSVCPSSIEDLTVDCETAVHVALRNYRLTAFEVLLGWLRRVNKEEILEWKDLDGNTALHIATSTNQPKAMKLIIKTVNVNAKNLSGSTAMDLFDLVKEDLRQQEKEVGRILHRAKAKRACELTAASKITLAGYLRLDLSLIEKRDRFLGIFAQSLGKSASDLRNTVLVVAVLIAAATYQAGLSPPGGYWQDDSDPSAVNSSIRSNTTTSTSSSSQGQQQPHQAGKMILWPDLYYFFALNGLAFYASVCTILVVITGLPCCGLLVTSTSLLSYAYYASLIATFSSQENPTSTIMRIVYTICTFVFAVITALSPSMALNKHQKRKRQVDTVTGRLGGLL